MAQPAVATKFFRLGDEMESVFRAWEPMAFVGVDDVFQGPVRLANRCHDLVAFGLRYTHLVCALPD